MTDVSKFFTALSERAYKENDLSDVTYAMCEADLSFRQFFLDFFFPSQLNASEVTIQREHSTDCGRPDFWIRTKDNKLYIVEVKIWDGSHHFEQYFDILKGEKELGNLQDGDKIGVWCRLGYIANYEIKYEVQEAYKVCGKGVAKDLCSVRTWEEFSEELKKYQSLNSPLVEAYAAYLARVCPYDDFSVEQNWKISIDDFKFIKELDAAILTVVSNEKLGLKKYTSCRRFRSCEWMGHFFEWTPDPTNKPTEKVWGWLGVYYKNSGAVLCVEFEDREGWGKLICDKWRVYVKDGSLRCYATNEWDDKDENVENAVFGFVSNVLNFVKEGCLNSITFEADKAHKSKKVLAMKALPFVLRDWLKGFIHGAYDVVLSEGSDAEVPQSHCGRYFEIRGRGTDENYIEGKNLFRGWIGALYNVACHRVPKENAGNYGDQPAFVLEVERNFVEKVPEGWVENNWGWISREIVGGDWQKTLENACNGLKTILDSKGGTQK